jgi:hypothetical protein
MYPKTHIVLPGRTRFGPEQLLNMSSESSSEMLSICIPAYTKPSGYGLAKLPKPVVDAETDVVIKVIASSINPIDTKKADGIMKMVLKDRLGYL